MEDHEGKIWTIREEKQVTYIERKAVELLVEIVKTAEDLTPEQIRDERFEISGSLFSEIYNFLKNNKLLTFARRRKKDGE